MANETDALELPVGITEKQFLQQLARVEARLNKLAGDAPKRFVSANGNIARSFRRTTDSVSRDAGRMRGNLQNVSFQLQDIFVQIAGGQGATRALAQQLPQLLGGFGALGAGIGVAVAAFPTLIGYFSSAEEEAGDLKDTVSALQSALKLLGEAQTNLATPVDELIEKYRELAGVMREAFTEQLRIAERELKKQSEALSSAFGEAIDFEQQRGSVEALERAIAAIGRALDQGIINQEEYNSRVAELRDELDPTLSIVDQLDAALQDVANAQSLEEYARGWAVVRDFIEENRDTLEKSGVEVDDLISKSNELTIEFGNAHAASAEIAGALGMATDVASGLSGQMRDVALSASNAAAAIQLAAGSSFAAPDLNRFSGEGITQRAGGMNLEEQDRFRRDWAVKMDELEKSLRSSRSGEGRRKSSGGRSSDRDFDFFETITRETQALERQISVIGKSTAEIAAQEAKWKALDAAKRAGIAVTDEMNVKLDEQAAEVGRLTEELEKAELAQQQFEDAIDGIADAMAGALVAGESLREGLAEVFKGIAADLVRSGIHRLISNIAGSFGFGGDPLASGLRAAGLPAVNSYDGGGFTGFGSRTGGVDGKGGIPAIVHPNETIIDHTKGQKLGGGAMNIHVTVGMDESGNLQVRDIAKQEASQMGRSVAASIPSVARKAISDPRKNWNF